MTQPYLLSMDESGGKPVLSVHAGAAHSLASKALLGRRQQSLDEPRSSKSSSTPVPSQTGPMRFVRRQGSIETQDKKKKQTDASLQKKIKSNMIGIFGAVLAVEQDDVATLKMLFGKGAVDVEALVDCGSYAGRPWTLLDVALQLKSTACASLLIEHGAKENFMLESLMARRRALDVAVEETAAKKAELRASAANREVEKQLGVLAAHETVLFRMQRTLEVAEAPDPPENVCVELVGPQQVAITFLPPKPSTAVIVKYKVEWSKCPRFTSVLGSRCISEVTKQPLIVGDLPSGEILSFRVSSGSITAFSQPIPASPARVPLSSWEDVEGKKEGMAEQLAEMNALSEQIERHRQSPLWQTVFPSSNEQTIRKKKMGLKELFTASSKFAKNVQRGCYMATIIYTDGKVLCTVDDCLPVLSIDETVTTISKEDVHWFTKLSLSWSLVNSLNEYNASTFANNVALTFRSKLISTAVFMQSALGLRDIGRLFHNPIIHDNAVFLVTVKFVAPTTTVQGLTLRWMGLDKLMRKRAPCSAMEALTKEIVSILNFFESSQIPLERGLYLCYMKLHSSLNSIQVVVPDNLPSVLPFVSIRENPHVSREEWEWIKAVDTNAMGFRATDAQRSFQSKIECASRLLLHDLDVDTDQTPTHRLYHLEVIPVHANVSFILILPRVEDVCSVLTGSGEICDQKRGCSSISIPVFEMIHLCTYQPEFIAMYCRLSIFTEHYLMITHYEQRKCLLEHDSKVYKTQYDVLTEFQNRLDNIWRSARWISRVASLARDRNARCAVPLGRLFAPLSSSSDDISADVGYHSDQSNGQMVWAGAKRRDSRTRSANCSPTRTESQIAIDIDRLLIESRSRRECTNGNAEKEETKEREEPKTGIIRVYAAYNCGLAKGTSVKLSIASTTASQEVVALVVEQLAKVKAERDGTPGVFEDPDDYCLAAVIGARERRLKDDFPILKLQNPWAKGKLFVRRRDSVLAAVKYGNEALV